MSILKTIVMGALGLTVLFAAGCVIDDDGGNVNECDEAGVCDDAGGGGNAEAICDRVCRSIFICQGTPADQLPLCVVGCVNEAPPEEVACVGEAGDCDAIDACLREGDLDGCDEAGVCEDAGGSGVLDASGSYLLAIAASVDTSKPLLFHATVVVDGDPPTVKIDLQPLTASVDRTATGEPFIADAVPVNREDGTFSINYGRAVIPGAADPIIEGAPIEVDLILNGRIQSETEICGQVAGAIFRPAMLPLEGNFGTNPSALEGLAGLRVSAECGGQGGGGAGEGGGGGEGSGFDTVIVFDDGSMDDAQGTSGADICSVSADCATAVRATAVLGDGSLCSAEGPGCSTNRTNPIAAINGGRACEAASVPSDYISVGTDGYLTVGFDGDLAGCNVTVLELAGAIVEAYEVYVCDRADIGNAECVNNDQPVHSAAAGGEATFPVPAE